MSLYYSTEKDAELKKQLVHSITLRLGKWDSEATSWCQQCFGHRWHMTNNPEGRWDRLYWPSIDKCSGISIYNFRYEADFLLFTLKWGCHE